MSNIKNNIFKGLMVSCMVVPQLIPVTSFAIDKNAVTTNGAQYATDSSNSVKTNTEAASQEQSKQNINITEEAYASFSNIKTDFQTMQSQYGNLSETNMSTGYQSYLNQVQNDKDNLALNYKLVAQKSGKYSVSENGLVLSQDKADALANALSSTAEDKQAMLEESNEVSTTTDTETESESEDKTSENESFVSKNAFGSSYQQSKEENESKTNASSSAVDSAFSQSTSENETTFKNNDKTNEAASAGTSANAAISKSYTSLQSTIKAAQSTISNDIKKAKSATFSDKVAKFNAYKSKSKSL